MLKEVIKFPDYKVNIIVMKYVRNNKEFTSMYNSDSYLSFKIESNTNYEKKKWSKMIRDDMGCGNVRSERRIYVHLPSPETHLHTVLTKVVHKGHF